ncbi:MAG: AAA family ATPase [Pirellulales bacterium]|nr:AAA family ATPase [Pirellulales bacterium]
MIEAIDFRNFKILRDATLPLDWCNILVGPNGSGKSTVLQALAAAGKPGEHRGPEFASLGERAKENPLVELTLHWGGARHGVHTHIRWDCTDRRGYRQENTFSHGVDHWLPDDIKGLLAQIQVFSLDAQAIAKPGDVTHAPVLDSNGGGLVAVMDAMRDDHPDRFKALSEQIRHWLPEFDRIHFDRPTGKKGSKSLVLGLARSPEKLPACDLSDGTLIVLALLTLAYLPTPPPIVCLEEPDRGIHPRLLRCVQDAMYRLSHPEALGEDRAAVQVIATTHSPYFLDLFRDHPEEIIVADRVDDTVRFRRVADQPHLQDILGSAPLGDAWFSGILGGVPSQS